MPVSLRGLLHAGKGSLLSTDDPTLWYEAAAASPQPSSKQQHGAKAAVSAVDTGKLREEAEATLANEAALYEADLGEWLLVAGVLVVNSCAGREQRKASWADSERNTVDWREHDRAVGEYHVNFVELLQASAARETHAGCSRSAGQAPPQIASPRLPYYCARRPSPTCVPWTTCSSWPASALATAASLAR